MKKGNLKDRLSYRCYRIVRWFVWLFYPKITVEGTENIPAEPCLLVGNHAKMNGPIIGELYIPGKRAIWCAGEMMELKEVPAYAYRDFWSGKPRCSRWFYKMLSYLIAPLSVCIFNQAHTIGVYRDGRILSTFRRTVSALTEGANVVIFPEGEERYNPIVNRFQDGFVDVARLYHKRTGKEISFIPMYIAPELKKVCLGQPVRYCAAHSKEEERSRICGELMDGVTALALAQPRHTVVPYSNIPKKQYPVNVLGEVDEFHEKAGC